MKPPSKFRTSSDVKVPIDFGIGPSSVFKFKCSSTRFGIANKNSSEIVPSSALSLASNVVNRSILGTRAGSLPRSPRPRNRIFTTLPFSSHATVPSPIAHTSPIASARPSASSSLALASSVLTASASPASVARVAIARIAAIATHVAVPARRFRPIPSSSSSSSSSRLRVAPCGRRKSATQNVNRRGRAVGRRARGRRFWMSTTDARRDGWRATERDARRRRRRRRRRSR